MWPQEEETVSLLSSFFSAIQQFSLANFNQNILLIGLEKDNIMFIKYKEYILSLMFTDRNEIALVDCISKRILKEIAYLLDREIDELQFDAEHFASSFQSALSKSGIFWLFEIAANVVRHENIMGASIFEVDPNGGVKPLYYPLEPYLGFEKIMASVLSCLKALKILRSNNIIPYNISFIANNGNGIQAWFYGNFVALLEYLFDKEKTVNLKETLKKYEEMPKGSISRDPLLEIIFSLSIDILGDLPAFCQISLGDSNIVVDCTEEDVVIYRLPSDVDITRF